MKKNYGFLLPTVVDEVYDSFKVFKCKFEVLTKAHDFGITSDYENGFVDALNEVYKLIHESEMPF